jgi:hypothetical protein
MNDKETDKGPAVPPPVDEPAPVLFPGPPNGPNVSAHVTHVSATEEEEVAKAKAAEHKPMSTPVHHTPEPKPELPKTDNKSDKK